MGKLHEDFEGSLLGDDGKFYKAGDTVPDGVAPDAEEYVSPWKRAGVNGEDSGKSGAEKAPGTPDPAEEGGDVVPPLTEADAAAALEDGSKTPAKKTSSSRAAKKTTAKKTSSSRSS